MPFNMIIQKNKWITFFAISLVVVVIFVGFLKYKNIFPIVDNNTKEAVEENNQTSNITDPDNYSYYYNQGFDVFGKVFIKISKDVLSEKGINEYDKIFVNNFCYYPIPNSIFDENKFVVADNCGATENTINKKQPYEVFLNSADVELAREILNFDNNSQKVIEECESNNSNYYPQELVSCNTSWHSWLFDNKLSFGSSYPTLPNYCLGISTSKAESCFSDVGLCLNACSEEKDSRDVVIKQTYLKATALESALHDSAEKASSCALSCTETANSCCSKKFLSS